MSKWLVNRDVGLNLGCFNPKRGSLFIPWILSDLEWLFMHKKVIRDKLLGRALLGCFIFSLIGFKRITSRSIFQGVLRANLESSLTRQAPQRRRQEALRGLAVPLGVFGIGTRVEGLGFRV